jgi:hypothetical protein
MGYNPHEQWQKYTNRFDNNGLRKSFRQGTTQRLLYKMKYFGISEQIINWVKSFLSNRTQTVLLENMTSSKIPVTSGVLQCTVLWPILIIIYNNMTWASLVPILWQLRDLLGAWGNRFVIWFVDRSYCHLKKVGYGYVWCIQEGR